MAKASTRASQRYKDKTYTQIMLRLPKEQAAAYKEKCAAKGIPYTQIPKQAIEQFLDEGE